MAEAKVIVQRPPSASSPPNCAICLGSCANKCFSDSCMHEFCFQCLLQWSKIKAECPLCKQPFKRIIHNVKSNEDYEEHVVETTHRNDDIILDLDNGLPDEFFIVPSIHQLPGANHPHRHEFHVRTTFTVDSRGEQAVQHMLLTHPLMAGGRITIGANYHHQPGVATSPVRTVFPARHRPRDFSATVFRRSIYAQNLWVNTLPDFTGRYRDVTPQFFRNNPAARTRLVPWLNRELNALLYENTQLIMHLVDRIMETLLNHHICSRYFRPQSPAPFLEDETVEVATSDDDSDVIIVGSSNPSQPVTIDLVETDSDEPELLSAPDQLPMPILPKREDSPCGARADALAESGPALPIQLPLVNLPPKLRHKHSNKYANLEKEKHKEKKKRLRYIFGSNSSTESAGSDVDDYSHRRRKRRRYRKKHRRSELSISVSTMSSSSDTEVNVTSDTEDERPLIDVLKKKWKSRSERDKRKKFRLEAVSSKSKGASSSRTNGHDPSVSTNKSKSVEAAMSIMFGNSPPASIHEASTSSSRPSETNGNSKRTYGESSRSHGESSRTHGESSRSHGESSRTHGEHNRINEGSSRIHHNRKEKKSNKRHDTAFHEDIPGTSGSWYKDSSRSQDEALGRTGGEYSGKHGSSSRLLGEPSMVVHSESSRTDEDSRLGMFRMGDYMSWPPIGYPYVGSAPEYIPPPMDLSVPVSLDLSSMPGCSRARSPESTTPPLPPDYHFNRIFHNLSNTSYDQTNRVDSLTPPLINLNGRNGKPEKTNSDSGSTTEDLSPNICIKNGDAEVKPNEDGAPSSSYKPLVLKREKNEKDKWYVWADTESSYTD